VVGALDRVPSLELPGDSELTGIGFGGVAGEDAHKHLGGSRLAGEDAHTRFGGSRSAGRAERQRGPLARAPGGW
jgi:hypothetical protein